MGNRNRPFFRLVVADSRSPRDGRFLELLGHYNPLTEPAEVKVDRELTLKWLQNGAQVSETARSLLRQTGIYQEFQQIKADLRKKKPAAAAQPSEEVPAAVEATPVAEAQPDPVVEEAAEETPTVLENESVDSDDSKDES